MDVWYTEFYTWVGYDPRAMHWYGHLRKPDYSRLDIDRKMRRDEIIAENRELQAKGYTASSGLYFGPDDVTNRFDSMEDLINGAVEIFLRETGGAALLMKDEPIYVRPYRILAGPPDLVEEGNAIFEDWKSKGGDKIDDKLTDAYFDSKWQEFMAKVAGRKETA